MAAAAAPPGIAFSEGFSTADIGLAKDDPGCLERSHAIFNACAQSNSMGQFSTGNSNWPVIAFDITSNDFNDIVTGAYGPECKTHATLVVNSNDTAGSTRRDEIARQLNAPWIGQNRHQIAIFARS